MPKKTIAAALLVAVASWFWKLWTDIEEVVPAPVEVEKPNLDWNDPLQYPLNFWDCGWPDDWTTEQKQLFEDELLYGQTAVSLRDNPPQPSQKEKNETGVFMTVPAEKPEDLWTLKSSFGKEKAESRYGPMGDREYKPRPNRRKELGLAHTYVFDEPDGHVITAPTSAVIVSRKPRFTEAEQMAIAASKLLKGVDLKPALAKKAKEREAAEKKGTVRVWFGPDGEITKETRVSSFLA